MIVSKQIEWEMGHRVVNHKSKCRNVHGHHYRLEICLEGCLVTKSGTSDEGMVIDFGDIKSVAIEVIYDILDHAFMVWEKDKVLSNFFKVNKDQKHIIVPFTTTSENIAKWVFEKLDKRYKDTYGTGLKLLEVRLWETPTSLAVCTRKDVYETEN
jgi:6-pyruvoyltetrahydropterin/6-carboxytetrahydropterin synthase